MTSKIEAEGRLPLSGDFVRAPQFLAGCRSARSAESSAIIIGTDQKDLNRMITKSYELPFEVALAFSQDMRAFFKTKDQLKRDEIASRQLHALIAFQRPRDKKLRLADVKQMFLEMRDQA
jgi:hypothetical protein